MGEPPKKRQRTLIDLFSGTHVQNDGTPLSKSVTITVSGNSITANATGESATSSVNCSPTIVLPSEPSQRQGNETRFPTDIAQSTADEPSQPLLAHFPTTIIGGKARSCQASWLRTHPWLEYSVEKDSCYCYPCRLFNREPSDSLFANPPGYRD